MRTRGSHASPDDARAFEAREAALVAIANRQMGPQP